MKFSPNSFHNFFLLSPFSGIWSFVALLPLSSLLFQNIRFLIPSITPPLLRCHTRIKRQSHDSITHILRHQALSPPPSVLGCRVASCRTFSRLILELSAIRHRSPVKRKAYFTRLLSVLGCSLPNLVSPISLVREGEDTSPARAKRYALPFARYFHVSPESHSAQADRHHLLLTCCYVLCGIPKQFFKTHLYKMVISGGRLANAKLNHASKRCAVRKGKRVPLIFEHPLGCFSKMLLPNPYHFKDCG